MEWNAMSTEELKNKLADLEEDLDEITLEQTMCKAQRGFHTSAQKIMEQCKRFEADIEKVNEKIASINEELKGRVQ